ncbi:MAG: cell wall hydrolase, partial [Brevundimonas sp.]
MLNKATLSAAAATARRLVAAAPLGLAVFGVAMAASSTPRPEIDQRVEAVRLLT